MRLAQATRLVSGELEDDASPVYRVDRCRGDDALHQAMLDVLGVGQADRPVTCQRGRDARAGGQRGTGVGLDR
jgi:hypothetical protein